MCFLEKRYVACAYVGHYVDGPSGYDRKACDEVKKQGEIGLCDELHTRHEPAFTSPFCELCARSENRMRDYFREALMQRLSEGKLCRPVLTKPLMDEVWQGVETPERAPRVPLDELLAFLGVASATNVGVPYKICAATWFDRELKLSSPRIGMTAMTELFAGWLTQALKARLINAAILIATNEEGETRLRLLRMLKKGTEVMMVYRARIECHGTWDLFLSLSGIRRCQSSQGQPHSVDHSVRENEKDKLAEKHQPLDSDLPIKGENSKDGHSGLPGLECDDSFDKVST